MYLLTLMRAFCTLLTIGLAAEAKAQWLSDKQAIMGTEISVTLWAEDDQKGRDAIAAVMQYMHSVDAQFSPYIPTSELAQLNAHASEKTMSISPEMAFLIEKSLYYSKLSQGAFDITFASVGWFYDYRNSIKPTDKQRLNLLPAINYHWLEFNKAKQTLHFAHKNVRIDMGGIAKGYAVDRAVDLLKARGFRHAVVSAGGDTRLLGDKLGQPWRVGIKNPRPRSAADEVITLLPLTDGAVSTSGDYERFFIDKTTGERVHHIINPKTGKSASEIISVTILGPLGVDTDGLTKCVFILGVEKGLALINRLPGFDTLIIDKHGKAFYSQGLIEPVQ
ncbi:MAG TPA: FAD:protein FMN transferase [Cellvibrionaceae bacterium]